MEGAQGVVRGGTRRVHGYAQGGGKTSGGSVDRGGSLPSASAPGGSVWWGPGVLPSLVQIFLVFPLSTPFGIGGVGLGALTPLFVLIFNTVGWSIPAYAWFKLAGALLTSDHVLSSTWNT